MKRCRTNGGFTMIELLVSVVIMVFLLIGMGVGMDSGGKVYRDASFETDSAMLAETLNNSIGDILRYSRDVRKNEGIFQDAHGNILTRGKVPFLFTNVEYGVQDAYLCLQDNVFEICDLKGSESVELVNAGAYPNLSVKDFKLTYVSPEEDTAGNTGYAEVSYVIQSLSNPSLSKQISTVIRFMN